MSFPLLVLEDRGRRRGRERGIRGNFVSEALARMLWVEEEETGRRIERWGEFGFGAIVLRGQRTDRRVLLHPTPSFLHGARLKPKEEIKECIEISQTYSILKGEAISRKAKG
jgi:hypothetical protein